MASTAGSSGTSGDCDGDEQEDSSSSSSQVQEVVGDKARLQPPSNQDISQKNEDDELSAFRLQWQRELESTLSPKCEPAPIKAEDIQSLSDDEKAKKLFLLGVDLERTGKLYEAIQHYKRAMQILPDVETRIYEAELRADSPEVESETEELTPPTASPGSEDEDAVDGEDLITRFQRHLAKKGVLCQMGFHSKEGHISWLPYELVLLILRWVVSSELDTGSLERVARVCRGLYVAAREPDIWRSICVKTWGIECGTPRANGYPSWRAMYIDRPRLLLHGCYISKTTYLRHGENCFQDHFYKPWYLVDYYRYLRFFPEGIALMWTTAEEPVNCVSQLKARQPKPGLGVMAGHYRLVGNKEETGFCKMLPKPIMFDGRQHCSYTFFDNTVPQIIDSTDVKVVVLIKKTSSDKKPAQSSNTRFRSRRKENTETHEQAFHLELELRTTRSRRNCQLHWAGYAVSARRDQWTQFELAPNKFPPFFFSRVRNYTADTSAPLLCTYAYT